MSKKNLIQTPNLVYNTPTDKKHHWGNIQDSGLAIETNVSPTLSLLSTPPHLSPAFSLHYHHNHNHNTAQDPSASIHSIGGEDLSLKGQESLSETVAKMKGDLQLLKALTMTSCSSTSNNAFVHGSNIIRKDLFIQLEKRLKVIGDLVQSTTQSVERSVPETKTYTYPKQTVPVSPNTQLRKLQVENETLRQRFIEFKKKSQLPERIPADKNSPISRGGSISDSKLASIERADINGSPGSKFVAELATMIKLDEGHHALLADIMDRQYGRQSHELI